MKKVLKYLSLFAIVLSFSTKVFSQTTYTWSNAAGGAWTTAANWTPTRTTPATTDILVFNTTPSGNVTMSSSAQTIGKLQVTSTGVVVFAPSTSTTLTISGGTNAFTVAAGGSFSTSGSGTTITLPTGSSADISGTLNLGAGSNTHKLTLTDNNSITFESGSSCTVNTSGSPFGSSATSLALFKAGSALTITKSGDIFGSSTNNTCTFQSGSIIHFMTTSSSLPTFSGRTIGDFDYNTTSSISFSAGTAGFTMGNLTLENTGKLTIAEANSNCNIQGNITVASGSTLIFAPGSASTVNFNGSTAQTITNNGTFTATNVNQTFNIANSNGVTLASPISIAGALTLSSGILTTTPTALLSVTNNSATAISGSSSSSYINGPVKWTLPASLASGSTYLFPVGTATSYLPFSLVNPVTGTGTITAQVQATGSGSGGSADIATLAALSTSQYWSLVTVGNFTSSSLSLMQPGTLSPYNAIGGSTALAGTYTSLAGTVSGTAVNNSNAIGTNRFFVFGQLAAALSTPPTLTAATGQTVDNNFNITFTDDATWRGAVTGIKVDGVSYSSSAYSLTAGSLVLNTSTITQLHTAASHTILVLATGYSNASAIQTTVSGIDNKLSVTQQLTAPATNGAVLTAQPKVTVQDQYGNTTTSTASISATVGAGTWTLGGTTPISAVAGVATFTDLTATSATGVTGATITFTSGSLTSATSTGFNIPTPAGITPPALTAAPTATVDNSFNITFTDDATWRGAVTTILVGTNALPGTAWSLSSGTLTLIPSQSSFLQTAATVNITVQAPGYNDAIVSQVIGAGAATQLAITTQPTAPTTNGGILAAQPVVKFKDQYNNLTASSASVTAATSGGTWVIGGTVTVAAASNIVTFSGLTAGTANNLVLSGATITFSSGGLTGATSNSFTIPAGPIPYTYATESFEPSVSPVTTWPTSDPGSSTPAIYQGVTGTWQAARAFVQTATGVDSGSNALTETSTSFQLITPPLNSGAGVISFFATSTSSSRTITVNSSTNGGGTYTLVGTTASISSSPTITKYSFTINSTVVNLIQIKGSGGSIALDNVLITLPLVPPILSAAANQTVDNNFNITFTDNAAWRAAATGITVDGTPYSSSAYTLTAGSLILTTAAIAQLQQPGNHTVVVITPGYTSNGTVSQTTLVGVATKLTVTQQPTAPASNGALLATQPIVAITDQYGNNTGGTGNITAAVGSGTWTLGGTTTQNAVAGVATFTDFTATSTVPVIAATITFTTSGLTSATSTGFNIPSPPGATPPSLTAAVGATVDNNFNITYTDDAIWRSDVTSVQVGGTPLPGAAWSLSAGVLTLKPSQSSLLQIPGTLAITVQATGYNDASISQSIAAGIAAKLTVTTQPTAPTINAGTLVTQPVVKFQDQYNNLTTSSALVTATATGGTWNIGGTVTVAPSSNIVTFSSLTAGTSSGFALSGATITFTASGLTSAVSASLPIPVDPILSQQYTYATESFESSSSPLTTWPTSDPGSTPVSAVGVTGTWQVAKAVVQSATGVDSGTLALDETSTSFQLITPALNKGAGIVSFFATATSTGRTITINTSTNSGASYQLAATSASISSSPSITKYSFVINSTAVNMIQFKASGSGVFMDNVLITPPLVTPTLSAATNQTVDNNFNITFTDDAAWRSAVTSISVDGTTYTSNYTLTAGSLVLNTAAISELHTPGNHTIQVVAAGGYSNGIVTTTTLVGADNKLVITQQPTAPATNGATLAAQPIVKIVDQYNNATNSTASVTATVGAGTWTLGGTTPRNAVGGTATFTDLTATSLVSVVGATITFTSGSLTSATSATFNIPGPPGATPPVLTAAIGATVDNNFNITYADDATWRGAVTTVIAGTNTLPGTAWSLSAGILTLKPSQSAFLQTAGSLTITVQATGYNDDVVSQSLGAGVLTQLGITVQPTAPASNGGILATQPVIQFKDQYNNLANSNASVTATTSGGTWNIGGTTTIAAVAGVVTFSGLTAGTTAGTALSGATITFSSAGLTSVTSTPAFTIPLYASSTADYFKSIASTDWATTTTWQSSADGINYHAATAAPTSSATSVELVSPFNVTMNANTTVGNVTIDNGATLTMGASTVLAFTSGKTVVVNGTLVDANSNKTTNSFTNASTSIVNFGATGILNLTGDGGHVPAATWNANSTLLISGVSAGVNLSSNGLAFVGVPGAGGFGNITIDLPNYTGATAFKPWKNFPNTLIIAGSLTLGRTGTKTIQTASGTNGNTLTIGGNLNVNAGTWQMNNFTTIGWTVAGNVIIDATVTYSPSTGYSTPNLITASTANTTTLTVSGNLTMVSGANTPALSQSAGTANIVFNGTSAQVATFNAANTTGTINYQVNNAAGVTLGSDLSGGSFTLTSGKLAIAGHSLTINGAVSGSGTLSGSSASSLTIGGTAGILNFTGGSDVLNTLSIGASGSATLGTTLSIASTGSVNVANGGSLATGNKLTLKSDASGTASVGTNTSGSTYISGDATVERYIPANSERAWRLLSVPTQTTQTINQSWQEGFSHDALGITGFGTIITADASNVAWSTNGFDTAQVSGSMLSYNQAGNSWSVITTTNGASGSNPANGKIATTSGYFLYIRGDRTQLPAGTAVGTTPTVLRTSGPLYQGTQAPISVSGGQYGLIGNIYASAIDFTGVTRDAGIDNKFYVWDPKLLDAPPSLGAYVTFSSVNNWVPVPGVAGVGSYGNIANSLVQSGQAFFVHASSTGNVTLNESSKASGSALVFRPAAPASVSGRLTTNLYKNGTILADGNVAVLNTDYSNAVDGDDALKLSNTAENFGLFRSGQPLVIEARQPVTTTDTLYYEMWNMTKQQYKLEFTPDNLGSGLTAYLKDNYLGTKTPISLSGITDITFNVDANKASADSNRFSVVLSASTPVPVTFTSINAQQQSNGSVTVSWKTGSATGIKQYAVEYSTDGKDFTTVGTVASKGTGAASYSFAGASATSGANYYRVEGIGEAGDATYSNIASLSVGTSSVAGVTVYPNPVTGNHVNIQFNNLTTGVYTARLLNMGGQEISEATVNYSGGITAAGMNIPSGLAAGTYKLEVSNTPNVVYTETVVIK